MIRRTIEEIEAKLGAVTDLPEEKRQELLRLLTTLKAEIGEFSKTHAEAAEIIEGFTGLSTKLATRAEKNPKLLKLTLEGLSTSMAGFEESHPGLVKIVNSICTTLSNLGI